MRATLLTNKELESLAVAAGESMRDLLAPISARLDALEADRSEFKYTGIWKANHEYRKGNFVTHAGGMWHCNDATTETPGKCNSWTLAVKGR